MENEFRIELVKKAKKGDVDAFIELCEAYETVLYNSAYKLLQNNEDILDCIQETEILAWEKILSLKNEAAFNTWLFRLMINNAKKILRNRVQTTEFNYNHISYSEQLDERLSVDEYLNKLPEIYKIPIVLHYYAGFSVKEIAYQLKIPKNTVKTRLARGRKKIENLMEEE